MVARSQELAGAIDDKDPQTIKTLVATLIRRVEVRPDCARIDICQQRLVALLASRPGDLPAQDRAKADADNTVLTLTVPMRLRRIGREMKLLVEGTAQTARPDMSLLKILARAHDVQARMNHNTALRVRDIAREDGVTPAYIYILLRLSWLAPDIVTAIVNGQQPGELNARRLIRLTAYLPADWNAQRALLGFRQAGVR